MRGPPLSRWHLRDNVENSLRRLGFRSASIIFQLHWLA